MTGYNGNIIEFTDSLFTAIKRGSKTATSRKGIREYKLGTAVASNVSGSTLIPIHIISITYKKFKDLADEDAHPEGYVLARVLQDVLLGIYPDLTDESDITLVNFVVEP